MEPHNKFAELPYDALADLLLEATRELFAASKRPGTENNIATFKKQVELIHAALVQKRSDEKPGSGIVRN